MRLLIRIGIVLAAAWLQISYFSHVRPFGVLPNLVLVVVILSALLSEATPTVATAILGGLLLDLASGTDFGLRTACLAAVALAVITARQYGMHSDSFAAICGVTILATLGVDVLSVASLGVGAIWHNAGTIFARIGTEAVQNVILAVVGYLAAASLAHQLPGRVRERAL